MKSLAELFGTAYKPKLRTGEFGMEIETETKNHAAYPADFLIPDGNDDKGVVKYKTPTMPKWKAVGDGSLRNFGIEFIFKEPYKYKEALEAIDIFGEATKKIKFIEDAPATSVHVHINMWGETFRVLGNFCTAYTLFENVLVEYAGPMRRSNLFSLPTRCAEATGWNLVNMFEGVEQGDWKAIRFTDEEVKYAALNLASLTRLGSLEVRMMRGVTDPKELKRWINILYSLLNFSRTEGLTPRDIITEYRRKGVEFFEEVFGKESDHLKLIVGERLEFLIDKNLYFAGSIASSVKNWDTLGEKITYDDPYSMKKKIVKKKAGDFPFDDDLQEMINAPVQAGQLGGLINQAAGNLAPNPQDWWLPPPNPVPPPVPAQWNIIDELPGGWGPDEVEIEPEF